MKTIDEQIEELEAERWRITNGCRPSTIGWETLLSLYEFRLMEPAVEEIDYRIRLLKACKPTDFCND